MAKTKRTLIWRDRKRTFLGLPLSFTKYSLSSDRLFIESGFLNVKEDEVRLYRIMDVSLKMTFDQRLLGIGTIHCCSADKTMGDFDIKLVKNPRRVKELLSEAIEKERIAKRVMNRENMEHNDDDFDDESELFDEFHDHDDDHN